MDNNELKVIILNSQNGNEKATQELLEKYKNMIKTYSFVNGEFKEELNIDLTIHIDPLNVNDEETKKIKEKVENTLKNFDKEISIHDFRVVTAKGHSNVIFDIVIPYGKNYNKYELLGVLEEGFKDEEKKYYFIFNIDRPFC